MMSKRAKPDYFSRRARQENFASRAVYKLADIDQKYRLFLAGQRVLDLGCAPGSWLQYPQLPRRSPGSGRRSGPPAPEHNPGAPGVLPAG